MQVCAIIYDHDNRADLVSKMCMDADTCQAAYNNNSHTCINYAEPPTCTYCCDTPLCNYYQYWSQKSEFASVLQ